MIKKFEPPRKLRFNREQYHQLGEQGILTEKRVELVGGEIIEMSPQNPAHSSAINLMDRLFDCLENEHRYIRTQQPIVLGETEEPEPDVALVAGGIRDHSREAPTSALLIVEIADSSLRYDRAKASLYAAAGIPEYWIVNLKDRKLEVHRQPNGKSIETGEAAYEERFELSDTEMVSPLCEPSVSFRIADMLPRG